MTSFHIFPFKNCHTATLAVSQLYRVNRCSVVSKRLSLCMNSVLYFTSKDYKFNVLDANRY